MCGVDLFRDCRYTAAVLNYQIPIYGGARVSQVAVSLFKMAVVSVAALVASSQLLAQSRADVLERIAPVGKVSVEGQASVAQPAAAPATEQASASEPTMAQAPAAEPEPVQMVKEEAAPAAQPEPVVAAPVAAQGASDGAALFVSKTCSACHGADANSPIMPIYPRLAGQNPQYLIQQMKDIKSGARDHGQTMLMKGIMAGVSDDEIKAIADWLGTL